MENLSLLFSFILSRYRSNSSEMNIKNIGFFYKYKCLKIYPK